MISVLVAERSGVIEHVRAFKDSGCAWVAFLDHTGQKAKQASGHDLEYQAELGSAIYRLDVSDAADEVTLVIMRFRAVTEDIGACSMERAEEDAAKWRQKNRTPDSDDYEAFIYTVPIE